MSAVWSILGLCTGGMFLYLLGTLNGTLLARSEQREALKRAQLVPMVVASVVDHRPSDGDEEVLSA